MLQFRIDELLKKNERSAYWLAGKLDMDYHNVKKLVDRETEMVRFETLEKLSDLFQVSIDELFDKYEDSHNK